MKIAIWCVVVALALVGIGAALERAVDTIEYASDTGELSPVERGRLAGLARGFGIEERSEAFAKLERKLTAATGKYRMYPAATLLHVLPGVAVLALGLAQFSGGIRSRYPKLHRISGRIVLVAVLAAALSGIFFGVAMPYGGAIEASATIAFGALMLFAAARAYAAIRRRDIPRHREWMIRMFAVAIGVALMRVISAAWLAVDPAPESINPRAVGMLLWIGWLLALAVAELRIRRTRPSPRPSPKGEGEQLSGDPAVERISGVVVAGCGGVARAHETVD